MSGKRARKRPRRRVSLVRRASRNLRWLPRSLSSLDRPFTRRLALIVLAYLVVLNGTVRYVGGGDAFLLSVFYVPQKSYAVAALALHSVRHVWSRHEDDPAHIVAAAAREQGVPVSLAISIARAESGFRPHCISATGAMGMMQLMPATARAHGVIDPFEPAENAAGATRFLATLWRRYRGDSRRVAAAYNAGPGRVPKAGPLSLPSETQTYVARVMRGHPD